MWEHTKEIIEKIEKILPVTSIHILGSFTTKKSRPADVDFMVLCKTKENKKTDKWSIDLAIAPDNEYGAYVLEDADKWVKEKYGLEK